MLTTVFSNDSKYGRALSFHEFIIARLEFGFYENEQVFEGKIWIYFNVAKLDPNGSS